MKGIKSEALLFLFPGVLLGCGNPGDISDEFYNEYKELGKPKILFSCTTIEQKTDYDERFEVSQECREKIGDSEGRKILLERMPEECPRENGKIDRQCVAELHDEIYEDPEVSAEAEIWSAKHEECINENYASEEVEVVDVYHMSSRSALLNYNGLLSQAKDECSGEFNIIESES